MSITETARKKVCRLKGKDSTKPGSEDEAAGDLKKGWRSCVINDEADDIAEELGTSCPEPFTTSTTDLVNHGQQEVVFNKDVSEMSESEFANNCAAACSHHKDDAFGCWGFEYTMGRHGKSGKGKGNGNGRKECRMAGAKTPKPTDDANEHNEGEWTTCLFETCKNDKTFRADVGAGEHDSQDCDWVKEHPETRCVATGTRRKAKNKKKDEKEEVKASEACPMSCPEQNPNCGLR